MIGIPLLGTQRPSRLVGRTEQLETLEAAISCQDARTVVVFIRGESGLGQTRLVEGVLLHFGPRQGTKARTTPHVIATEIILLAESAKEIRIFAEHTIGTVEE